MPVPIQHLSRAFEDFFERLEILRRDIHRELSMADTNKFHIDAQGPMEMVSHQLLDIVGRQSCVIPTRPGQRVLPLGDTGKKRNVLARKVVEGTEILKRGRIVLQEVLKGTHAQDVVPRVEVGSRRGIDGFPAWCRRLHQGRRRTKGVGFGGRVLVSQLPLCEGVGHPFTKRVLAHYHPAGEKDGEYFKKPDGKTNPAMASGK
jgi:hypothetical protein